MHANKLTEMHKRTFFFTQNHSCYSRVCASVRTCVCKFACMCVCVSNQSYEVLDRVGAGRMKSCSGSNPVPGVYSSLLSEAGSVR